MKPHRHEMTEARASQLQKQVTAAITHTLLESLDFQPSPSLPSDQQVARLDVPAGVATIIYNEKGDNAGLFEVLVYDKAGRNFSRGSIPDLKGTALSGLENGSLLREAKDIPEVLEELAGLRIERSSSADVQRSR